MGKKELSKRLNWERLSGEKAAIAEQNLYKAFETAFVGTKYVLHKKPKHLKNLYASVSLDDEVLAEIFNPNIDYKLTKWGVSPDFAIENIETGKILFGEIKRHQQSVCHFLLKAELKDLAFFHIVLLVHPKILSQI